MHRDTTPPLADLIIIPSNVHFRTTPYSVLLLSECRSNYRRLSLVLSAFLRVAPPPDNHAKDEHSSAESSSDVASSASKRSKLSALLKLSKLSKLNIELVEGEHLLPGGDRSVDGD